MAARSRAVEARLERLIPSIEEYYVAGIITKDEVSQVARTRQLHEFKLIARPLLYVDVQTTIKFEKELEAKVEAFATKSKLQLKHRWAVSDRIEGIYRVSIPRMRNREERGALEDQYVAFLRHLGRVAALSAFLASQMQRLPREPKYYCLAADVESELGNVDNARALVQKGLDVLPEQPSLWRCAVRTELRFVQGVLRGLRGEQADKGSKEARAREANDALGQILFDLALVRSIITAAWGSAAASETLFEALLQEIQEFSFTADLIYELLNVALLAAVTKLADAKLPAGVKRTWVATLNTTVTHAASLPRLVLARRLLTPGAYVEADPHAPKAPVSTAELIDVSASALAVLDAAAEHARVLLPGVVAAVEALTVAGKVNTLAVSDAAFDEYVAARVLQRSWQPSLLDLLQYTSPADVSAASAALSQRLEAVFASDEFRDVLSDELRSTSQWGSASWYSKLVQRATAASKRHVTDGDESSVDAAWANFVPGVTSWERLLASAGDAAKPKNAFTGWRWYAIAAVARHAQASVKRSRRSEGDESDDDSDDEAPRKPRGGDPALEGLTAVANATGVDLTNSVRVAERNDALRTLADLALRNALVDPTPDTSYCGQSVADLWALASSHARSRALKQARTVADIVITKTVNIPTEVINETVMAFIAAATEMPEMLPSHRLDALDVLRRLHRYVTGRPGASPTTWARFIWFEQSVAKRHDLAAIARRDAESSLPRQGAALNAAIRALSRDALLAAA